MYQIYRITDIAKIYKYPRQCTSVCCQEYSNKYYSEKAEYFSKQFKGSYPYNGPENWKTASYAFDYGNSHFCVIGTSGPGFVNEWLVKQAEESDKM